MTESTRGPLAGVRILDFTQFLSGPYGTQILGDLGAEVIKIESPAGDLSRSVAPNFVRGDSVYFHTINRNKRSLAVNLKAEGAVELVRTLLDQSDIVMENFRPGVLHRLGISRKKEMERNPALIWCSITGFGQDGPARNLPAYDMVVQAASGAMSLTGEEGGRPLRTGVPVGDLAAGLNAVIGVLAALEKRRSTGVGDYIDVSMLDCLVSMLNYQASYYLHSGTLPGPQGTGHDSVPTYRTFTCGDGQDVVTTANTERMWADMATVLGHEELVTDPRFATNTDRLKNKEALWAVIEPAFLAHPAAEWVRKFNELSIPAALVKSVPDALVDPQVVHREMVVHLDDGQGSSVSVPGNPIKFESAIREGHIFPPRLGADGSDVLRAAGLDDAAIDRLVDAGVVVPGWRSE
ncbi:CaiB/BaiF CoA transferase family protein [Microbacterium sp.]|uniref:CaiB/BaiF CoA transferase family protein n=1 Tax=Microbacterium sp. TaxID=51671 RepID=UPI003A95366A